MDQGNRVAVTTEGNKYPKFLRSYKHGVNEYIIVDPTLLYVERFLLEEGGLYGKSEIFGPKEVLPVASISDIKIPLWEVFEVEGPEEKAQGARKQESNS